MKQLSLRAKKLFLILLTLTSSTLFSSATLNVLRRLAQQTFELSKQIGQARLKQRATQHQIVQTLKKAKPTSTGIYYEVVPALLDGNPYPLLSDNVQTVSMAIQLFSNTTGFQYALNNFFMNLDNYNFSKGFLYELETAVAIATHNCQAHLYDSEYILAFGARKQSRKNRSIIRTLDIETDKRWIECKNIGWFHPPSPRSPAYTIKLQHQFLDQKKLADEYNEESGTTIVYEVHSKQPIPNEWQTWFQDHNIAYKEEKKLTIDSPSST